MRRKEFVAFSLLLICILSPALVSAETKCQPTKPDALGPFYKPNAPVRNKVGAGYIVGGTVRSSQNCASINNARIEFWLAGPNGEYGDAYRATLFSDASGVYTFESTVPLPYQGRPPHIHIRVFAEGFKTLVTQHYPVQHAVRAAFDLVLVPEK